MPDLLTLLPLLALGAVLGFLGGLFGIGGGIVAIPVMVLGLGIDQATAQGTALVMMVPNLLVGWWRYSRHQPVAPLRAATLGGIAMLTTAGVAHWASRLPTATLRSLFAGFLLLLALHLLFGRQRPSNQYDSPPATPRLSPRYVPLVGVVGGSSMGLLGIGGGLVATPIFNSVFGLRQTVAQAFALALVAPSSVVALASYASAQHVDWALGLPLAAGGLFTVAAGVALAHRLPEAQMRKAFAAMLLVTSVWMLVEPLLRAVP
jgi:uncharacterized protein